MSLMSFQSTKDQGRWNGGDTSLRAGKSAATHSTALKLPVSPGQRAEDSKQGVAVSSAGRQGPRKESHGANSPELRSSLRLTGQTAYRTSIPHAVTSSLRNDATNLARSDDS